MTLETLREAYEARPFKPFTLCLVDGRQIPVKHPEFMLLTPQAKRTFVVSLTPDIYKIVDALMVTSLDFDTTRNGKRPRR
ncbi:MAG: hypothetical protein HOP29_01920 [Phycisphaerales bacterium]|nr:hypothetical protein [Phycisphaerales bacterium]